MPKKSGRNLRESRIGKRLDACKIPSSEVIVKQFRSIHVNVKNAKRWFVLKKRLALVTDDELVAYLLDLAEPIIRRDGKCSRPGDWKTDQDKENDLEVVKIEEKDLNAEEPLRRSPRKQSIVGAVQSESVIVECPEYARGQQQKIPEVIESEKREGHAEKRRSKIKHHHKTKEKHHREKRTRRKHSKNNNNEEEERNCLSNSEDILSRVNVQVHESEVLLNNQEDVRLSPGPKIIEERLSLDEKAPIIVGPTNVEKKNSLLAENLNKNRRKVFDSGGEKTSINDNIERHNECEKRGERRSTDCEDSIKVQNDFGVSEGRINELESEGFETRLDTLEAIEEMSQVVTPSKKSEEENRRGKKKRKHSKHETSKNEEESLRPDATILSKNNEIVHKRRKKKHKRDSSSITHRTKKFHDVRKAPQDGLVENPGIENVERVVDAAAAAAGANENKPIENPIVETNVAKAPSENEASGDAISEPQRLAIKIKLCQDCNDRHIKDSCPLISTDIHFKDRISYQSWLKKHSENPEVTKALNSQDPISEGYPVNSDDNYESDEESSPNTEQGKNKTKVESEDKVLHVNDDRPLYSRESLPDCFQLKLTIPEHGVGIYAFDSLPIYAKFGPLVGDPIKEMDIPDDFSMRHLWEVDDDGKTWYISTTNPLKSNWVRYVRPADTKEDRNVTVVTKNGQLYLVTTQNIAKGTELTYWADSQSSAWTRKNKIDKTNCGGCNLNFTHSIYYRLHCCIFHDTRYSLTIRKYHCKVCGAAVLGKDNIMKHAADLHGGRGAYQCQYCRKFFLRLNYLEMHRTYGCSQNPQRSRPLCDFCGRKFCQPQKLKVHIKRMHSDMSEVLREFQCKMCLKLLGSRAALQRHMKEVHHKDVVGAATCDRCGKMFQNKSNLKIHMLTHSGVKPFKCKETDCKAAFTTKQCLQFHYKKVHGLSEEMMPKIERSVAYTFDAYSGGLVEGSDQQKPERSGRRSSQQQENSNSVMSLEDCSSEHSSKAEASMNSFPPTISEFESSVVSTPRYNLDRYILDREEQESELQERELQDPGLQQDCEMQQQRDGGMRENIIEEREMQEDEMEEREAEEIQESSPSPISAHPHQDLQVSGTESSLENERPTGELDFYGTRLQSKGSKKWMGQLSNLNDADMVTQQQQQQQHHNEATRSSDLYEFNETSMKKNEDRNEVQVTSSLLNSAKLGLNIYRRPESTNASLLVEAALDAAERDIGAVTSPIIDENDRDTSIYGLSSQLDRQTEAHLDPYIQQQEDLMSPASMSQENRKTPNSHVHIDYHIHRTVEYINNSGRTHSIEQYLPQDDLPRVASPSGAYNIHMQQQQQDDLVSPSATPNQNRYQDINHHHHHQQQQQHHQHHQHQHHHHHHHQVPSDNLSSDEGDSVAQNLSISVKEKSLQLDLSSSYKYEQLEPEFSRERSNFEPLVLSNGELQGLDMSARGFHHSLGSQITNTRYHHHLYEITERQSVDLSRSNPGYSISPPPTAPPPAPPPYPHSEVLRIVSLDLTPGHSVDLSLSRSHHLHSTGNRIISAGSPQPSGSSHVVPDTVEGRLLSSSPPPPPPPPPSITGYNANYPVSPAAYHPPRPGYHHYSGYY